MGFLSRLFRGDDPLAPQIWSCEPLVVWHEERGVVYARNTDAEFTPDGTGHGSIRALTPSVKGWTPELVIRDLQEPLTKGIYGTTWVAGRTLYGHDAEGESFIWYIGSVGAEILVSLGQVADIDG